VIPATKHGGTTEMPPDRKNSLVQPKSAKSFKGIAVIALLLGAFGLGIGVYSLGLVISGGLNGTNGLNSTNGQSGLDGTNGQNGLNGITGNQTFTVNGTLIEYPCYTESNITNALTAIGIGSGLIVIMNNIALTNQIAINGGGHYMIQGLKDGISITCNYANKPAILITHALTCTIQNLNVNASNLGAANGAITVSEANDFPVCVKNVYILGNTGKTAIGVQINSNNVSVSECEIRWFLKGVSVTATATDAQVLENTICNSTTGIEVMGHYNHVRGNILEWDGSYGIYSDSNNELIENTIVRCATGIYARYNNAISDNVVGNNLGGYAISVWDSNTITGNQISDMLTGIYIFDAYNTASGNCLMNVQNCPIYLSSGSNKNAISGNSLYSLQNGIYLSSSTYNTISGNSIWSGNYAIYLSSGSNNNAISGNSISAGGAVFLSLSNNNAISGNSVDNLIHLESSTQNTIDHNDFSQGSIEVVSGDANVVSENTMSGPFSGIWLTSSNNGVVSGNTIECSGYDGISLSGSNNNTVSGNNIHDVNVSGIHLINSDSNTIDNNHCIQSGILVQSGDENTISANQISDPPLYGINATGTTNTVSENSISGSGTYGIEITGDSNTISGNSISGLGYGIIVNGSTSIVSGNNFQGTNYSIFLETSNSSTISGNCIMSSARYGIWLFSCYLNAISGNTISNVTSNRNSDLAGICLSFSDNNTLYNNGCFKCFNPGGSYVGYGILLDSGSDFNKVVGNTALNNEQNYLDTTGTNTQANNNFY